MQIYAIFLLLILGILPGCAIKQPSNHLLLNNAENCTNDIVNNISKILQADPEDKKYVHKICKAVQYNLIRYIKIKSATQHSPHPEDLKKLYQELYRRPTEAALYDFSEQPTAIKPILYKLQTDIIFESQDILSNSNEHYRQGKLAERCPLLDSFLRLSFDERVDYARFIIDLLDLKYTQYIFKLSINPKRLNR